MSYSVHVFIGLDLSLVTMNTCFQLLISLTSTLYTMNSRSVPEASACSYLLLSLPRNGADAIVVSNCGIIDLYTIC